MNEKVQDIDNARSQTHYLLDGRSGGAAFWLRVFNLDAETEPGAAGDGVGSYVARSRHVYTPEFVVKRLTE